MEIKDKTIQKFGNYSELILSSNKLINVKTIVDDKGFKPLIIRKNDQNEPLIWLKAKSADKEIKLVDRNKSLIDIIDVNIYKNRKSLDVILNDNGEKYLLLEIDYNKDVPNIKKMDLRQIGYDIHGDEESLNIGTMIVKDNIYKTDVMIGV